MATFWNQPNADPKRKFRWILRFTGEGHQELQYSVKTADKPKFEISSTPHKFINHTFYFPGRLEWKPISLTFVDLVGSDDAGVGDAGDALRKLAIDNVPGLYGAPTGQGIDACSSGITKKASIEALGNECSIDQIDSEGTAIESWKLSNAWVSAIEFGSLDYSSEDLVEMTVTIVYDWATRSDRA